MIRRLLNGSARRTDFQGDYPYFTADEVRCKGGPDCDCGGNGLPSHQHMLFLVSLRRKVGILPVSSSYRCPSHNRAVGGSVDSAHVYGEATDLLVYGIKAILVIVWGYWLGARGFGIAQKGPHGKRFIHVDTLKSRNRPAIWTY